MTVERRNQILLGVTLTFVLILDNGFSMEHTPEQPRQCWRRSETYRWKTLPDTDEENPDYDKHCSMKIGPGSKGDETIYLDTCVRENCTEKETTCVRNIKTQEKNTSTMYILEGCAPPPKEYPQDDSDENMKGKLWDEYCENLLIEHMRPVYKITAYRCYCPNHREDETEPCNSGSIFVPDLLLPFLLLFLLFLREYFRIRN